MQGFFDALRGFAEGLRGRLAAIDGGAAGLARLHEAVTKADAAYLREAAALTLARRAAAKRLDLAMASELAPLKMERAVFTTEMTLAEAGPDGVDSVTFTVATNPGAPVYYGRAIARHQAGQQAASLSDIDQAIKLDPRNPQYNQMRAVIAAPKK